MADPMYTTDRTGLGGDIQDAVPDHARTGLHDLSARGPARSYRGVWIALAAASALLITSAAAVPAYAWAMRRSATVTWSAQHPVDKVIVTAGAGDVDLAAGPAGQESLISQLSWTSQEPQVTETWSADDTLVIEVTCSGHSGLFDPYDCGVGLTVAIPADVPVTATVRSGDLTAHDMTGPLNLNMQSGDVFLDRTTGPVVAHAQSGDVTGSGLLDPQVQAGSNSGDVDLDFTAAPTSVDASAVSGDVLITVPDGGQYNVVGQSVSGDDYVEPGLADQGSPRTLDVSSVSGDVYVHANGA